MKKGRKLDPQDDMVTTLFDVINMAEIKNAQRAKETDECSASECSAKSHRDKPHPAYRAEARLADNATADDAARAAAKAAADVDEWNRRRQSWSRLRAGSAKMEQAGAGSRVGPARDSGADSVHDSDLASLLHRSEVTMLTAGALAKLPEHKLRQASGSEPSPKSEKGFEAAERPPAVARAEPDQKIKFPALRDYAQVH